MTDDVANAASGTVGRSPPLADRYRIERELGAGGMATVYLAYDLKHDRKVALKVLRPELAAVIGAQRFLAEIKTTANLQHAHILSLFDSGEARSDGTLGAPPGGSVVFYVMPFVEGESLRDRLERERQLPVADAIRIAREIADALAYAHAHGVIHRDIKPENVLLQSGHALVADFGIALAAANTGGNRLTETGMSLGTPAYMSPEQAMGERSLDARTDIYALGCVLYEMLVGEPPFTGPTAQAIVARVMTEEPRSITAQRKTVPAHVAVATEIALSKLPADRFASAAEFSAALGGAAPGSGARAYAALERSSPSRFSATAAVLATALVIATGLGAWGWLRPRPVERVTRSYVKFPEAEAPTLGQSGYALMPDGSALVYVGKASGGTQLWTKKRSELHATALGGTIGASNAFVSPDGKWIGFVAGGKLKKIPVTGGEATTLADAACQSIACTGGLESGTWLEDGRIAFVTNGQLALIPSTGGSVDTIVTSGVVSGLAPILPVALPRSRGLLFTSCTLYCNKSNIGVVDLATRQVRMLIENAAFPHYSATGHLLYVNARGTAMAVPFDLSSLSPSGTATPVLDRVAGALTVSNDGTMAYVEGDRTPRADLVLVSRDGRTVQSVDTSWRGNFTTLALSPDGRRLAASIVANGQEHILIKTLGGGPPVRLTFGDQQNTTPAWTGDGASILFTRFEGTRKATFMSKRADNTGAETILKSGTDWVIESTASRDGQWLVMREYRPGGSRDIFARRVSGDTTERPVVATPAEDVSPALSPDSKWLVYASDEAGPRDVWVVPFPDAQGAKWQISTSGGYEPLWSRDGREIFYMTPDDDLVAAEVSSSNGFTVGKRQVLFHTGGYRHHYTHRAYDVMPDGQHFIMIRDGAPLAGDLVIVDHWTTELAARLKH
jgi:serine/threonine-protein kinase